MKSSYSNNKKRLFCFFLILCIAFNSFFGCSSQKPFLNASPFPSSVEDEQTAFDTFIQSSFVHLVSQDSLTLHFTLYNPSTYGISENPNCFPDISLEGQTDNFLTYHTLLNHLKEFSYSSLSTKQQYTYDIFESYLKNQIALEDDFLYAEPLSDVSGIHISLPILLCQYEFRNKDDIENYLALLDTIDIYFQDTIDFEAKKASENLFMSDFALEKVIAFCDKFGNTKESNPLSVSFSSRIYACDFLSDVEKEKFTLKNQSLIMDKVLPSYLALANKLESFMGSGNNEQGLSHFPHGKRYYSALVHQYTGVDDSVFAIFNAISHQRENDLTQMGTLFSNNPSLAKQCQTLEYPIMEPADILSTLKKEMSLEFYKPILSNDSISIVDNSLSSYAPPAYYFIAPIDNYQNNHIYYNNEKCSDGLQLFTTLAHEGYPGHLYQTTMSYYYGLEPIRSIMNFPGYTEGWATYVELLSYSYANLPTNVSIAYAKNYSVLLSLYASCDIGIHYFGWDYEKTLTFFKDYGITNAKTIKEIYESIIMEPGNYLKYYVGYLEFSQLRDKYEKYPIKDFHKYILEVGPAPFSIVDKYLDSHLLLQ